MKGTIGLALASGLALLVAGCATGGGGTQTGSQGGGATTTASAGSASTVRDFNLQVKCPGIHLEKTKLNWSDDKIEDHENVSQDDIASCEAWQASQPKGYVPPPPTGISAATPTKQPGSFIPMPGTGPQGISNP